jgi:hypothetical protein
LEDSLGLFEDCFEVCSMGFKVVDGLSIGLGPDNESSI